MNVVCYTTEHSNSNKTFDKRFYKFIDIFKSKITVMTIKNYFTNTTWTGFFWGIIGGISLIVATRLTTNGLLQISPYLFLLIAATLTIALSDKSKISLSKLFITGLLTFIIMTLFLYLYILKFVNPNSGINTLGHLWRLGIMIGIGIISSLLVSVIVRQVTK